MKPGYLVYEHRILVDLDDAEMVSLGEKDILKGIEDDIEMGQLEANIEQFPLTLREIKKIGEIGRKLKMTLRELRENHSEDEDLEDGEDEED